MSCTHRKAKRLWADIPTSERMTAADFQADRDADDWVRLPNDPSRYLRKWEYNVRKQRSGCQAAIPFRGDWVGIKWNRCQTKLTKPGDPFCFAHRHTPGGHRRDYSLMNGCEIRAALARAEALTRWEAAHGRFDDQFIRDAHACRDSEGSHGVIPTALWHQLPPPKSFAQLDEVPDTGMDIDPMRMLFLKRARQRRTSRRVPLPIHDRLLTPTQP